MVNCSRNVASNAGVYQRSRKDESGRVRYGKYEPRFKPPREKLSSGETIVSNYLPLGGYDTLQEAKNVYQIVAFYYGKGEGQLDLEDGHCYCIPSMTELDRERRGKEKAKWVSGKAREVYQDFKKEKDARSLPNVATNKIKLQSSAHDSSAHSGEEGACSSSADNIPR